MASIISQYQREGQPKGKPKERGSMYQKEAKTKVQIQPKLKVIIELIYFISAYLRFLLAKLTDNTKAAVVNQFTKRN